MANRPRQSVSREPDRGDPRRERVPPAEGGSAGRADPLRLASGLTAFLAALALLPRVHENGRLLAAVLGAAGVLALLQVVLRARLAREGRGVAYDVAPQPVHYVQALMQGCVYAYWGWYWPEVYGHVPLILAQIAFAYGLDMIVTWLRGRRWTLGFGQFPIILSTNLFMWFRDDWFFLQFAMVATGILGKQFVRWNRDGREIHVFNPSALSLFLFSIGLIATGSTGITWGAEIAATLGLPPGIYLEVFLVGLVVQALFSVTLVTLSAAASLLLLNVAYTGAFGTYHFIMTNIPIAVFLGLHLLVTDPATSPRTTGGKIAFGSLYGVSTFALFGILGALGVPTFYDKLLCVPVLNLSVRWLDRASRSLADRFRAGREGVEWNPRTRNAAAMAVWISLFGISWATGFIGREHPGRDPEFWRRACESGQRGGCETWITFLELSCRSDASACNRLGRVLDEGKLVERDVLAASKKVARACDAGLEAGCIQLASFVRGGRTAEIEAACDAGDGESCFILSELHRRGVGVRTDPVLAFAFASRACDGGWPAGCTRMGGDSLTGQGTTPDPSRAFESFSRGCRDGHGPSCSALAILYERGTGVAKDEAAAKRWFREACRLGHREVCRPGDDAAVANPLADPLVEIQKLGG